jgi:outer membrane lipoprotein carrier protein
MKKLVVGFGILMLSAVAHAAQTQAEQLKYKLAGLNSFQASFQQQVVDAQNKVVQADGEGVLTLQQPANFRFEVLTPAPNLLVGDGKTLWHYDQELEQVNIYNANKEVGLTPFALLTSTDAALWAQYEVTGERNQFIITPKDKNNAVQALILTFSGIGLVKMEVKNSEGQTSQFDFITSQNNMAIDPALFKFTPPANVEVDDQRNK